MTAVRRALGASLAAAVLAGVVWASHVPLATNPSNDAMLRLAWSARPERIEQCRRPGETEQANLPKHMRQELICEGATAAYRLEVRRGGQVVAEQVVRGGGLRHDRPVYVFHEVAVPPGQADFAVRFDRLDGGRVPRPGTGRRAREREAVPPHLSLEGRLRFSNRQVVLVTYDPDQRTLVARTR